ncbi:DMT family transporter [Ferruginibacter lapsinanis]|uniref:DMT family transporter n=1 Tax=Ferruginibacter lapsinanis TaxID=563172 RepID=UPI001E406F65|nr:DMT family transporter [Ferruginibacter lapsinanis]UEG50408.1 DMT family transporter [Ferruginibacter lapsinanis]
MSRTLVNWLIFIFLAIVWGSSFVLMKVGLEKLNSLQVSALRIASGGLFFLPLAIKYVREIPKNKLFLVCISGTIGNLIPALLFCMAEEGIDSALTGMLNSLTPIFVIITGAIFFSINTTVNKIIGICIAFLGCILLLLSSGESFQQQYKHIGFALYVVLATILYGYNVNLVAKKLHEIGSLKIASVALSFNGIIASIVLISTGYFSLPLSNHDMLISTGAGIVLGVVGTAIATALFYMLVKRAGGIFASMVTYGMPFVAIGWGLIYGEKFGLLQVGCLVIILIGVYITNRKKPESL